MFTGSGSLLNLVLLRSPSGSTDWFVFTEQWPSEYSSMLAEDCEEAFVTIYLDLFARGKAIFWGSQIQTTLPNPGLSSCFYFFIKGFASHLADESDVGMQNSYFDLRMAVAAFRSVLKCIPLEPLPWMCAGGCARQIYMSLDCLHGSWLRCTTLPWASK